MYRKFLLLAVAALTVLPAVSQKMKRHEVSVSYGYAPVFNWIDDYRLLTGQFEKPYISYGIGGVIPVSYTHLRAHETLSESRMPSSA